MHTQKSPGANSGAHTNFQTDNVSFASARVNRDIHAEIAGRELELLRDAGVDWPQIGQRHIRCPFPDHEDNRPSWRFDEGEARWFCTCGQGSAIDAIMRMKGCDFNEARTMALEMIGSQAPKNGHANRHAKEAAAFQYATKAPRLEDMPLKSGKLPSEFWLYQLSDLRIVEVRARYETAPGEKIVIPWTWNGSRWINKAAPGKRLLYHLYEFDAEPETPVLVVEGEKTADTARKLFPHHIVTTSSGGFQAPKESDWSPVTGRDVVIWPDHDEPGAKYAEAVAKLCKEAGAKSVCVVQVPSAWPKKWDLADEKPKGADVRRLVEIAADAFPQAGPDDGNETTWSSHAAQRKNTDAAVLRSRRASEINPRPIDWLWPGRLARGKLSMFGGLPGKGKTQTACSIAALISNGKAFPGGNETRGPSSVLFLSAEDSAEDTLVPRLMAAGADLDRVHIVEPMVEDKNGERVFNLAQDSEALRLKCAEIGDVALIVVDPISAYTGGADSHKNAEVRALLTPLSKFCDETGIAVLCITHLNKASGQDVVSRFTGSIAFIAAVRTAFLVCDDPEDEEGHRKLLLAAKTNIGGQPAGLGFKIEPIEPAPGIETSRIVWDGLPVTFSAEQALNPKAGDAEDFGALGEAMDFLREVLSEGEKDAKWVTKHAAQNGISKSTLKRAATKLRVRKTKVGFGVTGAWLWSLLPKEADAPLRGPCQNDGHLSPSLDHLGDDVNSGLGPTSAENSYFEEF